VSYALKKEESRTDAAVDYEQLSCYLPACLISEGSKDFMFCAVGTGGPGRFDSRFVIVCQRKNVEVIFPGPPGSSASSLLLESWVE